VIRCEFSDKGFELKKKVFRACQTAYHPPCISVGPPFTTRRKNGLGLTFPNVREWPTFICEACTVRAVLGRELTGPDDWKLLCFERMRVLDMAHYWADGTHKTYQDRLKVIRNFESAFGFSILQSTPLLSPPAGPDIPIQWCQESYSLRRGSERRQNGTSELTLAFSTVRSLRSAVSQFLAWDMMVAHPSATYMDERKRIIQLPVRPTDSLSSTLHAAGMGARIGDEAKPSMALLDRHVRFLDSSLNAQYLAATLPSVKRELALAGLANCQFWCGWLRTSETFGTEWQDFQVVEPRDGPQVDLPVGCGIVGCRLQAETKSNRTSRPDCLMAYRTASGYSIGRWFHRARRWSHVGPDWSTNSTKVFTEPDGSPWTSLSFRQKYLYPSLREQQRTGDPYLRPFTGGPGNSLEDKIWSLHCYRRGARSHVSRGGIYGRFRLKKATPDQVYEHARWRRKRSGEAIDKIYREWTFRDRIKITLYCM
jgi:hypothetical protein